MTGRVFRVLAAEDGMSGGERVSMCIDRIAHMHILPVHDDGGTRVIGNERRFEECDSSCEQTSHTLTSQEFREFTAFAREKAGSMR